MTARHTLFNVTELQHSLAEQLQGCEFKLDYRETCDSTNRECLQMGDDSLIVISDHQSAGRGRRGRQWFSPAGQNLYCSIGVYKSIPAEKLGLISLLVGICIARQLHRAGFTDVKLKWPNDVLMQGGKLGGILIETRVLESERFYLVIGMGLNLQLSLEQLETIDQAAISLAQDGHVKCNRLQLVSRIIGDIMRSVQDFKDDDSQQLLQDFAQYDSLRGKEVRVRTLQGDQFGRYAGLQADGQVRVDLEQGLQTFSAADISIRETDHAAD